MNEYDVIIIGGGLGGLSCGTILSKEGLSVVVLEQHHTIGGCLQSFRRDGHWLDTGMHYVGSLSDGQIMHQYFKYFGIANNLHLRKLDETGFDYFHFGDGSKYCHAMGYDRFTDTLSAQFPHEKNNLQALCNEIKTIGNLIGKDVLKEGKISKGGMEYMSVSAYREIGKYIKDEKLRAVMAGNCGLYAGNKSTTSLYEYGMITHSNIEGAYSFVDGSQHVADLLAGKIKLAGGEVRLNSKVAQIALDGSMVKYVVLESGEQLRAKWVISSTHPAVTFAMITNNTIYKKAFFTRMQTLPNTYGLFTTYIITKPNTVKYINRNHYLFNNSDVWSVEGNYKGVNIPFTLICMQPNSRNEYAEVVSLLTPMLYTQYKKWENTTVGKRGKEYDEYKQMFSEAVIDFVCRFFPDLNGCIDKVYTASPLAYRDYTSTPQGSAYGLVKDCRNPMVTLLPARTRIENLLLTGQSLNVHGCIGTAISASTTCSEILGMEYLSKKIGNA